MFCTKCGANFNEGDNFCEECGASLKKIPSKNGVEVSSFHKSDLTVIDSSFAAATNIGRRHHKNEDSGTVFKFENGDRVLIVADGVSSSFSATSASQMAIEVIRESMDKDSNASPRELIISGINAANESIKALPFETREDGVYGPEATVVVAHVRGNSLTLGWVGDSRAYIMRGEEQRQLTVDDSWVEMVVEEGKMTREEAIQDRLAHCVTQVLGMHDQDIEVHTLEEKLEAGDFLLVCSDGLWNYFQGENALLRAITAFGAGSDAVHICEHLVGLANASGGHDNITAALLKMQ